MRITQVKHLYIDKKGTINPDIFERSILVYGCKDAGRYLYELARDMGGHVSAFVDRRADDYRDIGFCEKKVIAPSEIGAYRDHSLIISFVFWPQIIEGMPESITVYADYPFWEGSDGECMLCGSRHTVFAGSGFVPFLQERMFLGEPPRTDWIHCRDCEVSYSSYRPSNVELGRLYDGYRGEEYTRQRMVFEPYYNNGVLFSEEATVKRRKDAFDFCSSVITSVPGSILDYGGDCGQYIPEEWKDSNRYVYEISGNETIPGVGMISDLEAAGQNEWDLIMNCHVLEHVSDPGEIITNIRKLMNENTLFYLELPCEYATGNVWVHEHINGFTKRTLKVIGEKYGLEILKCGNMNNGGGIAAIYRKRNDD